MAREKPLPTLAEIEEALRLYFSAELARRIAAAWKADKNEIVRLHGLLNCLNQYGDVDRAERISRGR